MNKKEKGTTMIELILYMSIFSLLLVMMTGIFVSALETQVSSQASATVDQEGKYILSRLTYDMQRASAITLPASPSTTTSPTLQLTINATPYTYSVNANNRLQVSDAQGTVYLHGAQSRVSNVSFQRIGNNDEHDTIQVNFTLTSTVEKSSGVESRSFKTTLGLN